MMAEIDKTLIRPVMNKRLNARSMYQCFEHDFGPFCAKVPPKLHFTVVIDFSRQRTKSDWDGWMCNRRTAHQLFINWNFGGGLDQ